MGLRILASMHYGVGLYHVMKQVIVAFLWIARSRKYILYFFLEDCLSRQAGLPWSRFNSRSFIRFAPVEKPKFHAPSRYAVAQRWGDLEIDKGSSSTIESDFTSFHSRSISSLSRPRGSPRHIMAWHSSHRKGDAEVITSLKISWTTKRRLIGVPRFYCWGPTKSPMQMTTNEQAQWHAHLQTPVLFNHHAPIEVESGTIQHIDLNGVLSTPRAVANGERVLILTPLKDAAPYLSKYFDLLSELTYPHNLIDLAFLVGDSSDDTFAVLSAELDRVQKRTDKIPFHSAMIIQKDFGAVTGQSVEERHSFAAQGPRRKAIGRARNYLLYTALKPDHSWVYWRDVDIQDSPGKILEDFMDHNKDILVPSTAFDGAHLSASLTAV